MPARFPTLQRKSPIPARPRLSQTNPLHIRGTSPWQTYVERVIATIRRECLDHVMVFSEAGLSRRFRNLVEYYHRSRTHLGLQKDTRESRQVQGPEAGRIIAIPEVGGLHHRYKRRAA